MLSMWDSRSWVIYEITNRSKKGTNTTITLQYNYSSIDDVNNLVRSADTVPSIIKYCSTIIAYCCTYELWGEKMIWTCAECANECLRIKFSRSQWMKCASESKCKACIDSVNAYRCVACKRSFDCQADLQAHKSAHRRRTLSCSYCHEKRTIIAGIPCTSSFDLVKSHGYTKTNEFYLKLYEQAYREYGIKSPMSECDTDKADGSDTDYDESPMRREACPDCAELIGRFHRVMILSQYSNVGHDDEKIPGIKVEHRKIQAEANGIQNVWWHFHEYL